MFKQILALSAVLVLAGCDVTRVPTGPLVHDTQVIETGKFEMARIEIRMGAGELKVQGGSPKLLEADFEYNVPGWKPVVESRTASFRADVKISQPHRMGGIGDGRYKWDLSLNDRLPMNIVTHLGAGQAEMNLGSVDLQNLEVHMGVGELRLDLRGQPQRDASVEIHGGIGEATVFLPNSDRVGISATAKGGIGDISVTGLEQRQGRWLSRSYDRAPVRIHLDVRGGIGNIRVVAE
jgi:uncharacterized protein DUF2154